MCSIFRCCFGDDAVKQTGSTAAKESSGANSNANPNGSPTTTVRTNATAVAAINSPTQTNTPPSEHALNSSAVAMGVATRSAPYQPTSPSHSSVAQSKPTLPPLSISPLKLQHSASALSPAVKQKAYAKVPARVFTLAKQVAHINSLLYFFHQESLINGRFNQLLTYLSSDKCKFDSNVMILAFNHSFKLLAASDSVLSITGFDPTEVIGGFYSILPMNSFRNTEKDVKFKTEIEALRHGVETSPKKCFIVQTELITKTNAGRKVLNKAAHVSVLPFDEFFVALVHKVKAAVVYNFEPDISSLQSALKEKRPLNPNSTCIEYFDNVYYSRFELHFGLSKDAFRDAVLHLRQQAVSDSGSKGFIINKEYDILAMSGEDLVPEKVLRRKITDFLPEIDEYMKSAADEMNLPGIGSPHCNTRQLKYIPNPSSASTAAEAPHFATSTAASPAASMNISQSRRSAPYMSLYCNDPFSVIILDFRPESIARKSFSSASRQSPFQNLDGRSLLNGSGEFDDIIKRATPSKAPPPSPAILGGQPGSQHSSWSRSAPPEMTVPVITDTHLSPPKVSNSPRLGPTDSSQTSIGTPRIHGTLIRSNRAKQLTPRKEGGGASVRRLHERWGRGKNPPTVSEILDAQRGSAPASTGFSPQIFIEPPRGTAPASLNIPIVNNPDEARPPN